MYDKKGPTHTMPDGRKMKGKTHPKKPKRLKKKKETIKIGKEKITFKKGGLHRSLKVKDNYTFKTSQLSPLKKIKTGATFTFAGKKIKMTSKIKSQINLGLTLMGFKK